VSSRPAAPRVLSRVSSAVITIRSSRSRGAGDCTRPLTALDRSDSSRAPLNGAPISFGLQDIVSEGNDGESAPQFDDLALTRFRGHPRSVKRA
jgi:hypothetical protein